MGKAPALALALKVLSSNTSLYAADCTQVWNDTI